MSFSLQRPKRLQLAHQHADEQHPIQIHVADDPFERHRIAAAHRDRRRRAQQPFELVAHVAALSAA